MRQVGDRGCVESHRSPMSRGRMWTRRRRSGRLGRGIVGEELVLEQVGERHVHIWGLSDQLNTSLTSPGLGVPSILLRLISLLQTGLRARRIRQPVVRQQLICSMQTPFTARDEPSTVSHLPHARSDHLPISIVSHCNLSLQHRAHSSWRGQLCVPEHVALPIRRSFGRRLGRGRHAGPKPASELCFIDGHGDGGSRWMPLRACANDQTRDDRGSLASRNLCNLMCSDRHERL